MGALAPVSYWIPKDDLLLKNAVEAGASLESLAKGAVHFSRSFTVRELEDRWYSLLYDPVMSAEASACMIEYERSALPLPSKFNRFSNLKENKSVNGKRKAGSVRSCYYALRKRICSEPFDSNDLSFLVAPISDDYVGNGDEPLSGSCVPGDPISNSFNFEGSEMDTVRHTFAQHLMDGGDAANHAFHPGFVNPGEGFPYDSNNMKKEYPPIFENDLSLTGNGSVVEELGHQIGLQECSLFGTDDTFGQINNNQQNICSDFEENRVFNSPISEYGGPYNNVDYSSPLSGMSIWRTVSAPELPVDLSIQEKNLSAVDTFELPGDYDVNSTGMSGFDIQSDVKVKSENSFDDFRGDINTEGYFAALSNSLLNFTNEELMSVDGKEMIDKSYFDGLSSLLLNSPNGGSHDRMMNLAETETSVAPDICIMNSSVPCLVEPDENKVSHKGDDKMACNVETGMQSSISASFQFPELKDGFICCTINTEDLEVPDNNDVFLTNILPQSLMSSITEHKAQEANNQSSSSVEHFSVSQRTNDRGTSLMHKEQKILGELHVSSQMIGSHASQEMVLNCGVKLEHSASDCLHLVSRLAGAINSADHCSAAKLRTKASLPQTPNDEGKPSKNLNPNDCYIEKPGFENERLKTYARVQSSGIHEENDVSDATICHQVSHEPTPVDIVIADTAVHPPTPDEEADFVESDNDVPSFSDIEAMVLDMDLDPYDQDLFSSEEVSRYQLEETKRAIIRLEQGAHSYLERAIASHGAIAILYGRHLKRYIKKPEVLLGRATKDIAVDIDLGRECHANKVSRRQAIIKLEKCGSFYLKNLGNCVITVNNKEVDPGQSTTLHSSCLIEIRGLTFIFEASQTRVKQYLHNIAKVTQTQ